MTLEDFAKNHNLSEAQVELIKAWELSKHSNPKPKPNPIKTCTCLHCKNTFVTSRRKKYCSEICRYLATYENIKKRRKKSTRVQKDLGTFVCEYCLNEFKKIRKDQRFCSRSHSAKSKARRKIAESPEVLFSKSPKVYPIKTPQANTGGEVIILNTPPPEPKRGFNH